MNTGAQSPLWYATRGLGLVLLLVLTASVVLGVAGARRWKSEGWPAFLLSGLHRNLGLLAIALLPLHAGTILLDSYAKLGWSDVLVPFSSAYRPLWLGLGVLSGELLIAIVATSLLRPWLGLAAWRLTHWSVYAAWPLAMLHGLGTGTDTRATWALFIYLLCAAAVAIAIIARLATGSPNTLALRMLGGGAAAAVLVAMAVFTAAGPLRPGWAAAAGTPRQLLASAASAPAAAPSPGPSPSASPTLPTGLDLRLQGTISQASDGSLTLDLNASSTPPLEVIVGMASPDATGGSLRIVSQGQVLCQSQATFQQQIEATCGSTNAIIEVRQFDDGSSLFGRLVTQALT